MIKKSWTRKSNKITNLKCFVIFVDTRDHLAHFAFQAAFHTTQRTIELSECSERVHRLEQYRLVNVTSVRAHISTKDSPRCKRHDWDYRYIKQLKRHDWNCVYIQNSWIIKQKNKTWLERERLTFKVVVNNTCEDCGKRQARVKSWWSVVHFIYWLERGLTTTSICSRNDEIVDVFVFTRNIVKKHFSLKTFFFAVDVQ